VSNESVVKHLQEIAELLFLAKEDQRGYAYAKAANSIKASEKLVTPAIKPGELKYVGPSIVAVVLEFLETGTSSTFEKLSSTVERPPADISAELQKIQGVGPVKAMTLWKAGFKTIADVEAALASGALKDERLKKSVEYAKNQSERIPFHKAYSLAAPILDKVKSICTSDGRSLIQEAEYAGSLRRRKETVKDIDILCSIATDWDRNLVREHIKTFWPNDIIADGVSRTRLRITDRQCDIIYTQPNTWGAALQYLTGSADFNVRLRAYAKTLHFKVSEYQLLRYPGTPHEEKHDVPSEQALFEKLGIWYVEPHDREGVRNLELAIALKEMRQVPDMTFDKAIWLRTNLGICTPAELKAHQEST
jgi:DNA polymerase (family 10)